MKDKEFLKWLADRLIFVCCENSNVDFVMKLKAIVAATPAGQVMPNILYSK